MNLKPSYTIGELAALAGMSRFRVHRMLKSREVPTMKFGKRALVVPLLSFQTAFPELWHSIVTAHDLEPGDVVCEVCGSMVSVA